MNHDGGYGLIIAKWLASPSPFLLGNRFLLGQKWTIWRQGDQLMGQATVKNESSGAFEIYPESETKFFVDTNSPQGLTYFTNGQEELTFIKNHKSEVMALIHHMAGLPDGEGKKI